MLIAQPCTVQDLLRSNPSYYQLMRRILCDGRKLYEKAVNIVRTVVIPLYFETQAFYILYEWYKIRGPYLHRDGFPTNHFWSFSTEKKKRQLYSSYTQAQSSREQIRVRFCAIFHANQPVLLLYVLIGQKQTESAI